MVRLVLAGLLLASTASAWNIAHALKKHKVHKKRVKHLEDAKATSAEALKAPVGTVVIDHEYTHISGKSYYAATQMCKKQGKRLCDKEEYCEKGKPLRGQLKGDRWAPVGNTYNDWVQVGAWAGSKTGANCMTHRECCTSVPAWGNEGQTAKMDQVRKVFTCPRCSQVI
jgi:hypothetical protein